jgi:hypothetical protein
MSSLKGTARDIQGHKRATTGPQREAAGRGLEGQGENVNVRARIDAFFGRSAARRSQAVQGPASAAPPSGARGSSAPSRRLALTASLALLASLVLGVSLAVAVAPTVAIEDATGVGSTVAHVKGEVDPQGQLTEWHFEYITDAQFQQNLANAESGFQGASWGPRGSLETAAETVEGDLESLQPNMIYHLRLRAENIDGPADAVASNFTTVAIAPSVGHPGHTQLGEGKVIIAAFLNPHNSPISDCHFDYGTDESYGQSIPCEGLPPTNNEANLARATISGLTLGAEYHFRLSAANGIGPVQSDDGVFVPRLVPAQPSCPNAGKIGVGFLPDCRAWEMVSPPDKNGGDLVTNSLRTRVASTGDAAQFFSLSGFADAIGMSVAADYVAKRSTDPDPGNQGWSTHAVTPEQEQLTIIDYLLGGEPRYVGAFSDDLSAGAFLSTSQLGNSPPNVAEAYNLFRRDDLLNPGSGHYTLLTDCLSPPAGPCENPIPTISDVFAFAISPEFAGASSDFDHVLFESGMRLTNNAQEDPTLRKAYESTGGAPRLVGILPNGSAAENSIPGRGVSGSTYTLHPISSDGSRISFTAIEGGSRDLFARINADSTIQLNASEKTIPGPEQDAAYWDASADGKRVFFTSAEALTDDAPSDSTKLYMWKQAEADEQQSVTVDAAGGDFTLTFNGKTTAPIAFNASSATVDSALEDLISVKSGNVSVSGGPGSAGGAAPYLVTFTGDFAGANVAQLQADGTALSGGASTVIVQTTQPVANLTYLSSDDETNDGTSSVVGVIGASASGDRVYFAANGQLVDGAPRIVDGALGLYLWHQGEIEFIGSANETNELFDGVALNLRLKQSYVSPTGDLVFGSRSGRGLLSAHGGVDYDHGACVGFADNCRQLYVYNADTKDLQCASCNPSGAPGTAGVDASNRIFSVGGAGGSLHSSYLNRPLSNDGRYVFFSTAERLVNEDTNGVSDAYVYDTSTGRPSLLSSGESAQPSYFMDASSDGKNAFFLTSERLSGWDLDGNVDLYDARIGGGFPEPPIPPPSCQGDACQPPPLNLNDPTPASSSFQGSGNPASARRAKGRCPQGRRRVKKRNGGSRCVRKDSKRTANAKQEAGR